MDNSDFEKIILILESNIPSNYFLDLIIIILRTIPVFLVCHDWNIFYKYSITYIITIITSIKCKKNIILFSFSLFYFVNYKFIDFFKII